MRLISQLIKGISRVLQKLLKYFNGIAISTSFVLPAVGFFPVILILGMKDLEFTIAASCDSSLQYHKIPDVFKYLPLYYWFSIFIKIINLVSLGLFVLQTHHLM